MLNEIKDVIFSNFEAGVCRIGISFDYVVRNGIIVHSSLLGNDKINYN